MAVVSATPDTSAQLMKLSEAELLGVFDDHQRGVRHVHAHFHHGGGEEHLGAISAKVGHHRFLFFRFEPSVQYGNGVWSKRFGEFLGFGIDGFDAGSGVLVVHPWENHKRLSAGGEFGF